MICLKKISKNYRMGQITVSALQGVDLTVESGEIVGLSGASGSGKSTLLNIIGLMDAPTQGQSYWENQCINHLKASALVQLRRKELGVVFQHFNLNPVMTAYENIEFSLMLLNVSKKQRRQRILEMLNAVGLTDQQNQRPNQLSGGQQQRVAIARALVKRPRLIVADEPTASLDSQNRHQVLSIMRNLCQQQNASLIMATHDADSLAVCERVIEMSDGQIVNERTQTGGN